MWELKPGNGGHGLEPFNTKTGKYEKIGISLEGHRIEKWEDLIPLCFDDEQKAMYNEASSIEREPIDNFLKEKYEELLSQEIERLNKEESKKGSQAIFDTVEEALNGAHELFTDELLNFCEKNATVSSGKNLNYSCVVKPYDSAPIYSTPLLSKALQMYRYPKNKFGEIDEKEYSQLHSTANKELYNASIERTYGITAFNKAKEIINTSNNVIVARGIRMINNSTQKEDYYKSVTDKSVEGCVLASAGGFYGSVAYFSMNKNYAKRCSSDYKYGIFEGVIEDIKNKKILYFPEHYDASSCPEIHEFRVKKDIFLNKLRDQIKGKISNEEDFINSVRERITYDAGYVGMLLGYDLLLGERAQLDVLNPSAIRIKK